MCIIAALQPTPLSGQDGATLPAWDPAYHDLAVLDRHGLLRTVVVGQRPWSWREVGRLVDEARAGLESLRVGGASPERVAFLEEVLARLVPRVSSRDGRRLTLEEASIEASWLDSPVRGFSDNNLGGIDVELEPLMQYRDGRRYADGVTTVLEGGITAAPAPWLTLQVGPRVSLATASLAAAGAEDRNSDVTLHRASARVRLGNLALLVGREPAVWGPASSGGLLVSRNARSLDQLQLTSDGPFYLPGPLSFLGPTRLAFFSANLGQDREPAGALLIGWKGSILPHPNVELGAAMLNMQGGDGAPDAKLWDRFVDILVIPDLLSNDELLFSEKIGGADIRVRLPGLRGLELYLEGALTDMDLRRAKQTFWEEAAYQGGVVLPRLGARGASALDVEVYRTGVRFYRHHQFVSGLTLDRKLMGNGLGPDGRGASVRWMWDGSELGLWSFAGAVEDRSADLYIILNEPFEHNIVRDEFRPHEHRWRLSGRWQTLRPFRNLHADAELAVERVLRFEHVEGAHRTNALARLQLTWRP